MFLPRSSKAMHMWPWKLNQSDMRTHKLRGEKDMRINHHSGTQQSFSLFLATSEVVGEQKL